MSRRVDTSTDAQMSKIIVQYRRPSRSSWEESVRTPSGRTLVGRTIWESSIGSRWRKVFNWECSFVNRAKEPFLSVYADEIKMVGKTENVEPTWKILMKDVDVGEPTSLLFMWVALKENVRLARILWIITEVCSNQGFLQGLWKNTRNKSHGGTWCRNDIFIVLEGHAKKCGKILRTCE